MKRRVPWSIFILVAGLAFWSGSRLESLDMPSWLSFGNRDKADEIKSLPVEPSVLNLQDSFAGVAAKVKPAVVNITSVHVESYQVQPHQFFFGDPFEDFFGDFFGPNRLPPRAPPQKFERRQQGMGSGVVIDPRGYILTNDHVVRGATEIQVRLPDSGDAVYKGKVVGTDPRSDLAVVKIKPKGELPYAILGNSDKVRVGDWSIAVGSPFGLEQTVTAGIISAVRQSLSIEGKAFHNMLQTDAAINQGNSGGPLVNIRGEVIGINTAIYAPTGVFAGVGFAIPSNYAKEIMEQLIDKGRVVRGWLGVEIAPVDEVLARQFGLPDKDGVLVNRVMPDSPAAKAGLRRGDVVREFDGHKVATPDALQQLVGKTAPEKKVKILLWREGREKELWLSTGKMPEEGEQAAASAVEPPEPGDSFEWEGARFAPASSSLAERYQLPSDAQGVVTVHVGSGGGADAMGLAAGDLIASLNGKPTPDIKSFKKAAKDADLEDGVVLDVNRRGRWFYMSYKKP